MDPLDLQALEGPGELSPAKYRSLARKLGDSAAERRPLRLILLTSFNSTFLNPFVAVECARLGFSAEIVRGEFGEFETALMSSPWGPAPADSHEVLVLNLRPEDLDPDCVDRSHASDGQAYAERAGQVAERLAACVELFRRKSPSGTVLVANHGLPPDTVADPFAAGRARGLPHRLAEANRALAERFADEAGVHLWDWDAVMRAGGTRTWADERMWALARTPVAAAHHAHIAAHLARTIRGVLIPPAKCLVLDLDQTLWGGAVGDDGLTGIQLGDDFPGNTFKALQRVALGLRDRGILLAVASKNDEEVALGAMANHPEMLIRPEHLAAHRIGWSAKSQGLREIAIELNIGLDALVFLDDNPVERAEVRANAPEVIVPELPKDSGSYAGFLRRLAAFDAPALTEEDRSRAASYAAQKKRAQAEASVASPEEFLTSLEMSAEVGDLDEGTTARIAQLVGKTNQFNVTTRRRTQNEIEAIHAAPDGLVRWLRLRDRFGDLGLIGILILRKEGDQAVIDSLVMSCRAANRGVEQALVSVAVRAAASWGCNTLVGEYLPTERNHVVAELYPGLGFAREESAGDGSRFSLALPADAPAWPAWIAGSGD